jgi:heme oxygenase
MNSSAIPTPSRSPLEVQVAALEAAPPSGCGIMQRLKEQTAELHSMAESAPLQRAMVRGALERERFAAYLGQLLTVHKALEASLAAGRLQHPAIARVHQAYHDRSGDLRCDLAFYGVDPDAVEPGASAKALIARMNALASSEAVALLGLLYVLEGSNNGS